MIDMLMVALLLSSTFGLTRERCEQKLFIDHVEENMSLVNYTFLVISSAFP